MKTSAEIITISLIILLGLSLTLLTGCTSLNQGSDELTALVVSRMKIDCLEGRLCASELEIGCFDAEDFYSPQAGTVCKRYGSD
jgi:hypothetical protein